ncbi:hypothetical protein AB0K81_05470 [Streptomyces werraensis]|uniref:YD repeat-containing protein n=1 Tax=Streptomyces werraensis TaxID=68284 RepID=A0ABV3J938_9ACTN
MTSYAYDAEGQQIKETTPLVSTGCTLGARGLLTKVDYSDITPDVSYAYDPAGQMTTRANSKVSEDFVHDAVGNLTKTRGFAYTHDAAGRLDIVCPFTTAGGRGLLGSQASGKAPSADRGRVAACSRGWRRHRAVSRRTPARTAS